MISRFKNIYFINFVLMTLVSGCGAGNVDSKAEEQPEDLQLAVNADYKTLSDMRQECLGRHVFDVRLDFQWGVPPLSFSNARGNHTGFGELLFPRWGMDVDGVNLGVAVPGTIEQAKEQVESILATERIIVHDEEKNLATDHRILKKQLQRIETDDSEERRKAIEKTRERIQNLEKSIAQRKLRLGKDTLEIDLPDSTGYALTAYLIRDGRFFSFVGAPTSNRPAKDLTRDDLKKLFLAWIKRFRPRALFEIPDEPGICIPYGFIADEGSFEHDLKASFRYADNPGVFYHLHSKTVGEKGSKPMFMETASRALASKLDWRAAEAASRSIGPRKVTIGALPAQQGGYELNYPTEDERPVKTYSVFTGRGGERGSMVLPDLSVEMESYVPEQSPEVTVDPPSLDESMERLNAFLAGFRLRPTEPPLPELQQLKE